VLFSFAKSRGYLPASESAAAELVPLAKEAQANTEIFQPVEIQKLLTAASADILPLLAIGGFAGLRVAEICRLDWSAVDLERRIITLRADQAKTASRRIVPISDNLAGWLKLLHRKGKVTPNPKIAGSATDLAKKLGIPWRHNGLRHSYISYRIAQIKDAAKVALEAGNSPDIIFKHYRELVTEQDACEWFSITPAAGWSPPESEKRRYAPRATRRKSFVDAIIG
jgi:integrase